MTDKTDIEALRGSAECMASLLDNLAGYEPQDIDMDTVELRFEDEGGYDTGCDISIVDTAQKSADIIRSLLDQLEAERQRADDAERAADNARSSRDLHHKVNAGLNERLIKAEAELAALRGEQEPVGLIKRKTPLLSDGAFRYSFISDANLPLDTELFTRQPKPVVVLPAYRCSPDMHTKQYFETIGFNLGLDASKAAIEAAGFVVKDGV